ncbi:MAG: hypothetical protein H0T62_08960 [Parachlamydiaceae bacterium]|nr:hypothetical protein [Parachlamydiaceae bacterium]
MHVKMTSADTNRKSGEEDHHNIQLIINRIKSFEHGYQVLTEEITRTSVEGFYSNDPEIQPIPIEKFKIALNKMETIKNILSSKPIFNRSIHALCNFSTEVQLLFYEIALSFYEQANYEKSIDAFIFLTTINPEVQAFWIGLALGYEKKHDYYNAIDSFKAAIKVEPNDFGPYYGFIRCSEAIHDYRGIEDFLENAKKNELFKEKIQEALEYLKIKK